MIDLNDNEIHLNTETETHVKNAVYIIPYTYSINIVLIGVPPYEK